MRLVRPPSKVHRLCNSQPKDGLGGGDRSQLSCSEPGGGREGSRSSLQLDNAKWMLLLLLLELLLLLLLLLLWLSTEVPLPPVGCFWQLRRPIRPRAGPLGGQRRGDASPPRAHCRAFHAEVQLERRREMPQAQRSGERELCRRMGSGCPLERIWEKKSPPPFIKLSFGDRSAVRTCHPSPLALTAPPNLP